MKKYLAEFIGTFFLVATVCASVRAGAPLAPLAIGSALMVMVYACGHISGGHLNPAVTLGVWLRGKCAARDVAPYWIAQLAAGVVAALLVAYVAGKPVDGPPLRGTMPSLIVEFLVTFALVWVVLNVATAKATAGNSFYGLAIGFTVFMGAVSVGGISGGAFNPAVGLGVFVMGLENLHQFGVFFVADLLGGAAAALAFKAAHDPGE
jgi:aquaporin Z